MDKIATYRRIIAAFQQGKHPDPWLEYARTQSSLKDAIGVSAMSLNASHQKHPHQYRRTPGQLAAIAEALLEQEAAIAATTSFEELMAIMDQAKVPFFGELTRYDVATRIGAYLGFGPERIYLHAGVREGAQHLGIDTRRKATIAKEDLPEPFAASNLSCTELEDLLCLAKDLFGAQVQPEQLQQGCRNLAEKPHC